MRITSILVVAAAAALGGAPPLAAQPPHENHDDHEQHAHHHGAGMMARPLGIPATRDGSGTSWQPDATPMHAYHIGAAGWLLMLHGSLFAGFDAQSTERGDEKVFSPGWIMAMARRPVLSADVTLRAMLSVDAVTMGERGYPLLLQSGEAVDGEPLADRQHPHDLFMELAASTMVPLGGSLAIELYGAPAGEPALGPVAFPHRRSASADPLAVLGHHWEDSSHISFGVLTAALVTRVAKLEASWFNGREPDQDRYDLDLHGLDSYAIRLSLNPEAAWSGQVSYGRLDEPEELEPGVSVQRITASLMHVARPRWAESVATTAVWGHNIPSDGDATDAGLLESTAELGAAGTVFGRAEVVVKAGHDLALAPEMAEDTFAVGSLVLGYLHDFGAVGGLVPGIGARGALNLIGDDLAAVYGTHVPVGAMVFVRIEPAAMEHGDGH
ncbi:MAG TPA: hypothetical protein VKB80_16170 [Kofleriaceae bacterium]|nr:hypothetical protein [Kofleriaceae bacterium]